MISGTVFSEEYTMDQFEHIELRCLNKKCEYSGYIRTELFEDLPHFCPLCSKPLVSEVDVAVFTVLLQIGIPTKDYS